MTHRKPFTVETAAEHLGCSESHVRNLCNRYQRGKSGGLRHFRIGRLIRIPAAAMEELECVSSGSGAVSTDIGEKTASPVERRSELRIVRLPSDA
jgi:excisionase family DNA binding protein